MPHNNAAFCTRPCKSYDVLGTDVRSKDGRTYNEPAHMPSGQKIFGGRILLLPDHPPGNPQNDEEIESNNCPVEYLQSLHIPIPPNSSGDGLLFTIKPLNMSNCLSGE